MIFCWTCFAKFPRQLGRYCSYLLPMQALATHKKKHNKISQLRRCPRKPRLTFRDDIFLLSCLSEESPCLRQRPAPSSPTWRARPPSRQGTEAASSCRVRRRPSGRRSQSGDARTKTWRGRGPGWIWGAKKGIKVLFCTPSLSKRCSWENVFYRPPLINDKPRL